MLPVIPADKANHALYGAASFSAALLVAHQFAPAYSVQVAAFAVAAVAIGKEAADRLANWRASRAGLPAPHGVEILDAVATCAGGMLAAAPMLILAVP